MIDGETGFVADAFVKDKLLEKILILLSDKVLQSKFAKNGYEKLKRHFSLDRMTLDTIEYYKDVII